MNDMKKQQKYDWRKQEKEIYPSGKKLSILNLGPQRFITISGTGNPNEEEFSKKVGALYALSYTIKMAPKKNGHFPGAFDYSVYPLEGFWTLRDPKKGHTDKANLAYKIMLKQPEFVTVAVFNEALKMAEKKVEIELQNKLQLEEISEGLIAQLVHQGSFDSEPETFEKMEKLIHEEGYQRVGKEHKEIYLKDFNKTAVENLKTILRIRIEPKN